jgi:hypothetical protein
MIRILTAWWLWITNRNNKLAKARLKICSPCDKMKWGVCKICGCPIQTKIRLYDESCPLKKWSARENDL